MPDQDRDKPELRAELEELRVRLEEAEETLRAIQEGEVDAVVVSGPKGEQVYALSGSLQEHMHFLQTLLDTIPNPVFYKGVNGLFMGCNQAYADYFGRTKEEIVGKTAEDLYPPDLAERYTKSDLELLERPGVQVKEYPAIYADGSRRQVLAHKTTFTNVDGTVAGILEVLLDITERKQAEEALAASVEKWQTTFDAISDAICLMDNNFKILQCNRAMMDLLGKPAAEIIGGTCWKLVHGTAGPVEGCPILRMRETLRPETLVLPMGDRWLEVSVYPVMTEAGSLAGVVHIIADITAAKQAEERLLRLNRLYSLMLKINEAIVRIRDLPKLYQQVCRLAVEEGTFRMAWVGLVEPETRCVKPLAFWGFEKGYLDHIRITVDDVPAGRGPSGTCIRTDKTDICNDVATDPRMEPWREEALKRGYRSAAAFPLKIGHRTVGALNLYAGAAQFFTPDQVQLLESLCADLSFALEAAEQEEQRQQAEAELRRAKEELEERVAERTLSLWKANEQLADKASELEQRHREITLLSQMSEVLQSCRTMEEAHKAVAKFLRQLFPADSGALFIFGASGRLLEAVAAWGEKPIGDEVIDPDDCWALRLGRTHLAADSEADLRCPHVADASRVSLCVPLMGQGEALGVLHLLTQAPTTPQLEAKQQLALSVGDRVGLGLANLRLQETLRNLSVRDPLTGLFNRRYLEESLEREVSRARRQDAALGIIMLDLDHFKDFNDTFGHEAGDVLLREVGALLQQHIRGSDVACRYGGEEFTLILAGASKEVACRRAEELRAAVKNLHLQPRRHPLGSMTISAGVALFPEHGDTAAAVMHAADAALYRAKEAGRDRVVAAGGDSA